MDPEEQGGTHKIFGLPWYVVIGIAAIGAYLIFKHKASSQGSPTTSGGGGTITTGNTRLAKGAVTVNITAPDANTGDSDTGDNDQPKPPHRHKRHHEVKHPPVSTKHRFHFEKITRPEAQKILHQGGDIYALQNGQYHRITKLGHHTGHYYTTRYEIRKHHIKV